MSDYKVGDRVQVIKYEDSIEYYLNICVGDIGTVTDIENHMKYPITVLIDHSKEPIGFNENELKYIS